VYESILSLKLALHPHKENPLDSEGMQGMRNEGRMYETAIKP
jgi:hypothetical protein